MDGGGEFLKNRLERFVDKNGITLELSMPYQPSENGKARKNEPSDPRHHENVDDNSWHLKWILEFASTHSSAIWNTLPRKKKKKKYSPYYQLSQRHLPYERFRIFGAKGFARKPKKVGKFDYSIPIRFLGFASNYHSYLVQDARNRKIFVAHDVKLVEVTLLNKNRERFERYFTGHELSSQQKKINFQSENLISQRENLNYLN